MFNVMCHPVEGSFFSRAFTAFKSHCIAFLFAFEEVERFLEHSGMFWSFFLALVFIFWNYSFHSFWNYSFHSFWNYSFIPVMRLLNEGGLYSRKHMILPKIIINCLDFIFNFYLHLRFSFLFLFHRKCIRKDNNFDFVNKEDESSVQTIPRIWEEIWGWNKCGRC